MNYVNYKIIKYKIKFLNSIKNANFDKSVLYLKKYSNYYNKNNYIFIQTGGSIVQITNKKDLDDLIINISNLINTIFGKDIGNNIINEFNSKTNFNKITYPAEINFDILTKNIFKSFYSNSKTNKYFDDEFEIKINTIINNAIKETKTETKSKEYTNIKDLLDLLKTKEESEQTPEIKNIIGFNSPHPAIISTPIVYSQPMIYSQPMVYSPQIINWNSDDLGLNIKIVDDSTDSSSSELYSNFSEKTRKKYKKDKNKFGKNIIIY